MGHPRLACALLLALCCCRYAAGVPGEEALPEPEQLEVEVGGTALLLCGPSHAPRNISHADWFSVYKEKQTLIFRVHQGQGKSEPGEYQHRLSLQDQGATLALSHVTPHDERVFLCQGRRPRSQAHRIQLRVYKAPEEPSIKVNDLGISVNSEEPEEVATCEGRNGYPIPQVVWYKNGHPLKEEKNHVQVQSFQVVESSGLHTLRSILKARLGKADRDARFYCELSYRMPSGYRMKESQEVTVPVFYPAEKVWLEVEPEGQLKEGDRVQIRCLADGNPQPPFTINWKNLSTAEMEEQQTEENGVLVLEPVRRDHSGIYQCQGLDLETTISLQSDPQELLVNYVSDVHVSPSVPVSQEGGSLSLKCEAQSNLDLEFRWLQEKTGRVLAEEPVLQLQDLKREAGGGYSCLVLAPSVPGLNGSSTVNVTISGSPWMVRKKQRMQVKANTTLDLSCEASGYPRPNISWTVEGMVSEADQGPQSVVSILNVLVTPELLDTNVECVAANALGRNSTIIFLELEATDTTPGLSSATVGPHTKINSTSTEKKLRPPAESKGVVIVAVTVCVLLLAVLGATLYYCYKKGRLPCGRSGKQEITLPPPPRKSEFVVEVKSDKLPEEMGLLQGGGQDQRAPGQQGEKYIDLRH